MNQERSETQRKCVRTRTRLCSFCGTPVAKRTGAHHYHRLIHKKCKVIKKFLNGRTAKCQECGRENPKYFENIRGLELGFCGSEHAQMYREKGTLRKIMEAVK